MDEGATAAGFKEDLSRGSRQCTNASRTTTRDLVEWRVLQKFHLAS